MIEILNQKFPEEITMNILKFMRHETADIINDEIENIRCNCSRKFKPRKHFLTCFCCKKKICMRCKVYDKNIQGEEGDEIYCGICLIDGVCDLAYATDLERVNFKRGTFDYIRFLYYDEDFTNDQIKAELYHNDEYYFNCSEDSQYLVEYDYS